MVKAVIFDFDGTLSNRRKNAYDLFDVELRKYFPNMNDIEYEAMLQDFLTDDCNGTIKVDYRVIPFMAKYKELPSDFLEQFKPVYYDIMWKYVALRDDTIETLKALQGKYKLAVLSNGDSKSQHDKITNCHIDEYFDEVVVSGDIGINKPDKRIFEIMAEKLNVKPEECVFVGDVFSSDILGAIRANMIPVWITPDPDTQTHYYKGIRISKLSELIDELKKLESDK